MKHFNLLLFKVAIVFTIASTVVFPQISIAQHSVAREWNDALLEAIRKDFARPTVHARNLFHSSVVMYDAWAVYEPNAETYFLGDTIGGYYCAFTGIPAPSDKIAAQEEAVSYAAYRLLKHRFANSPNATFTMNLFDTLFSQQGYNPSITGQNYAGGSPAELGNYLAAQMIAFGLQDGANEVNGYVNTYYNHINPVLLPMLPGNPDIVYPNRWQPLTLETFIDQSGNIIPINTPPFQSPEWGHVVPFALNNSQKTVNTRNGDSYTVFLDPGNPPKIDPADVYGTNQDYQWGFSLVSAWSSFLDPTDSVMVDISPASLGNLQSYPTDLAGLQTFYDVANGGDNSTGYTVNPETNAPYTPQLVPRGDYTRVLAEFWADGPDSETPPGHWFTILNYVNDHSLFEKRWEGKGPILDELEWDVKAYFTLSGAVHDAAVAAWGVKGWYDYLRPISAIRYMADQGQCSDTSRSDYSAVGIPLIPGLVEDVLIGDALAGPSNENVGKYKVKAWRGPDYITNPATDQAGVGWILAENWWPYQRPTFVTPPFAGYVSGHSTFSRAAAEVMTKLTGTPYFPGGMGEFVAQQNQFLVFEEGPSVDVVLQWATYRDASDQCSLSRIYGGIHPPADDIPGRLMGIVIGTQAVDYADQFINPNGKPDVVSLIPSTEEINDNHIGPQSFSLTVTYDTDMNDTITPAISFPSDNPLNNTLTYNSVASGWTNAYTFVAVYDVADSSEVLTDIDVSVSGAENSDGIAQEIYSGNNLFTINTKKILFTVFTDNVSYTSARLNWTASETTCSYLIRGRIVGNVAFIYLNVNNSTATSVNANKLERNENYEWQIAPNCPVEGLDTAGAWSDMVTFTTLDCVAPSFTLTTNITSTSARLNWNQIPGATGYIIKGRKFGGPLKTVTISGGSTTFRVVNGLIPSTFYEWAVIAKCQSNPKILSDFSLENNFTTAAPKLSSAENNSEVMGSYVFPNPTNGKATIVYNNPDDESFVLQIFDVTGKEVYSNENLNGNSIELENRNLNNGIYFYYLKSLNYQYQGKFVIQ